jgi:hypothetical protein
VYRDFAKLCLGARTAWSTTGDASQLGELGCVWEAARARSHEASPVYGGGETPLLTFVGGQTDLTIDAGFTILA